MEKTRISANDGKSSLVLPKSIVEKGENVVYQHFILYSCFQRHISQFLQY